VAVPLYYYAFFPFSTPLPFFELIDVLSPHCRRMPEGVRFEQLLALCDPNGCNVSLPLRVSPLLVYARCEVILWQITARMIDL